MNILTVGVVGAILLLPMNGAFAQGGNMMNGDNWGGGWMGGYGGYWVPILLVVLIGVIVWAVLKRRK